ncbi:hypothetical protein PHYPSEUDO_009026 [Phytophthora pseudosyringae]|uniref:BAHD acyltransferase n=1 Tax=Phytophthora pseudosyringae TaxID=221518 RepID=A0A8T1VG59_9STRA|nr:hypothetical protein PHYPSEUDO_009026 [Phytophthora pseudosyringae]
MIPVVTPAGTDDDVLIPLSAMDAVMNTYRIVLLYIYPPPASNAAPYDLDKLRRSFVTLVDEDYPVLVGALHVDQKTSAVRVKQTPLERQRGGRGIRFEPNQGSAQTTEKAIVSLSWEFMPKPRAQGEIIAVKGSILMDGGMAIGVDCSHVLFDGEAMLTFMRAWGQHYSGVSKQDRLVINHDRHLLSGTGQAPRLLHPEFQIAPVERLIRRKDGSLAPKAVATSPQTAEHVFHLSPVNMAKLKKLAGRVPESEKSRRSRRKRERFLAKLLSIFRSNDKKVVQAQAASRPPYVSTLDAVTALFVILISQARGHAKDVRVSTAVNGRNRLEPPLPANYSGNAVFHAISSYSNEELRVKGDSCNVVAASTLSRVARGVRASILARDNAFMRDTIAFVANQRDPTSINDNVNFFFGPDVAFTCWANMGLYDAEFAGVTPWYAKIPRVPCMDGFALVTEAVRGGDGLDVLVCLEANAMEKLKELSVHVEYFKP